MRDQHQRRAPDAAASDQPGAEPHPAPRLHADRFALGPFETNCYVLYPSHAAGGDGSDGDRGGSGGSGTSGSSGSGGSGAGSEGESARADAPPVRPAWIIDASFEPGELIQHVRALRLQPELLILTHAHLDHIAGITEVRAAFPAIRVLIHEAERDWLQDPQKNLSAFMGQPITAAPPDRLLREGDELNLAGHAFRVLHTPGHSPGGLTLWCPQHHLALVGDTLFAGSVGRTDFPGSDPRTLALSIRSRLYTLPPATRVLPGHGPETTIARERATNPFVQP